MKDLYNDELGFSCSNTEVAKGKRISVASLNEKQPFRFATWNAVLRKRKAEFLGMQNICLSSGICSIPSRPRWKRAWFWRIHLSLVLCGRLSILPSNCMDVLITQLCHPWFPHSAVIFLVSRYNRWFTPVLMYLFSYSGYFQICKL